MKKLKDNIYIYIYFVKKLKIHFIVILTSYCWDSNLYTQMSKLDSQRSGSVTSAAIPVACKLCKLLLPSLFYLLTVVMF
jgi:hypothetical protein